jgi:hypothetical protein
MHGRQMNSRYDAILIPLLVLFVFCRTFQPEIRIGGYTFEYQDEVYRIVSVAPNFADGYNILLLQKGESVLLKGYDFQQNGELDSLEIGSLTLEAANDLYQEGIEEGKRQGYIRVKSFAREYRTRIDYNYYVLATYMMSRDNIYNKLIVSDLSRQQAEVLDLDADGQLDEIKTGKRELAYYQAHYRMVLIQGMEEKRVVRDNSHYIVIF